MNDPGPASRLVPRMMLPFRPVQPLMTHAPRRRDHDADERDPAFDPGGSPGAGDRARASVTATADPAVSPSRRWTPWLAAVLCCLAVDAAFLGDALFTEEVRAPFDLLTRETPFRSDLGITDAPPRNLILGDWASILLPWHDLTQEAWREGRIPHWTHLSGGGAPLAGNMQSQFWSPFEALGLISERDFWDLKQAAQLLIAQMLCLVLAARLGLGAWAGVVVALAYGFGTSMQGWCLHPNSQVAAWVPGLVAALVVLRRRFSWRVVAAAAALLSLMLVGGHPETAFLGGLMAGLLGLFVEGPRVSGMGRYLVGGIVVVVLGVAVAAVQVVPFLDYLSEAAATPARRLAHEGGVVPPPSPVHMMTALDPESLGSPYAADDPYRGHKNVPESGVFMGRAVLLLALVGLILGAMLRPRVWFGLVVTAAAGLLGAYDGLGVRAAVSWVPGFDVMPLARLTFVASLPLCLLAGLGVEALHMGGGRNRGRGHRAILAALGAGALLLAACVVLPALLDDHPLAPVVSTSSLAVFAAATLLAAATGAPGVKPRWRGVTLGVLVIVIAGEAWVAWHPWVPVLAPPDRSRMGRTLDEVRRITEGSRVLPAGWLLPPDMHALARLPGIRTYDAIGLLRHRLALTVAGGFPDLMVQQRTVGTDARMLDAMGVGWVLATFDPRDGLVSGPTRPVERGAGAVEELVIAAGGEVVLVVVGPDAGVTSSDEPEGAEGDTVRVHIAADDGTTVERTFPWSVSGAPVDLGFGQLSTTPDAALRAWLSIHRPGRPALPLVIRSTSREPVALRCTVTPTTSRASLVRLLRTGFGELSDVQPVGPLTLARRPTALPVAYFPADVAPCTDPQAAVGLMMDPAWDPHARTVVEIVEAPPTWAKAVGTGRIVPLAFERPCPEEMIIHLPPGAQGGVVVVAESFSLGWTATVDGEVVPVYPANLSGRAVPVPPGAAVVSLRYRPRGFSLAVAASCCGTLALLLTLLFGGGADPRTPGLGGSGRPMRWKAFVPR
jgi:hypothetical protein